MFRHFLIAGAFLFVFSKTAHAEEDCLSFIDVKQQIACLARENVGLREQVKQLQDHLEETIAAKVAALTANVLRKGRDNKFVLSSDAYDNFCMTWVDWRNSNQGNMNVQAYPCNVQGNLWFVQ
jgi:hypothetical protein